MIGDAEIVEFSQHVRPTIVVVNHSRTTVLLSSQAWLVAACSRIYFLNFSSARGFRWNKQKYAVALAPT